MHGQCCGLTGGEVDLRIYSVRDKKLSLPTRRPSGECHETEICENL